MAGHLGTGDAFGSNFIAEYLIQYDYMLNKTKQSGLFVGKTQVVPQPVG